MELKINIEDIISNVIAGYILFLITKNHSNASKSGIEFKLKSKHIDIKFKQFKN
jgi:hypothetical protein